MNMKRKATSLVTAGLMLLPICGAAESPAYLTDGVMDYPLSAVVQKQEAVIGMPGEKMTFSYSFEESDVQYSDFLFAPQPFSAGIKFYAEGIAEHTLTIQVVDKTRDEVVEELKDVSANGTVFIPTLLHLDYRHGYYFRLSAPSATDAAGTFTVEVLGQEAETMLRAMKIISGYENGQYIPQRNISRAEMCAILAKLTGYEEVPPRQVFDDVPASHWASAYIAFCCENGIVKGTGENLFSPDAELTGADMITMLVRALGRMPEAEAKGGYPYGYMIVAAQTDITRGTAIIGDGPVTRKTAMECTYNSLFVPLMAQTNDEAYAVLNGKDGQPLDTLYLRHAAKYE